MLCFGCVDSERSLALLYTQLTNLSPPRRSHPPIIIVMDSGFVFLIECSFFYIYSLSLFVVIVVVCLGPVCFVKR